MKYILFYIFISFTVCTCRLPIDTSRALLSKQVFYLSPVTIIEVKRAGTEKLETVDIAENSKTDEDTTLETVENAKKISTDEDTRCSIYDNECQKNFFQEIAVKYASTGIPEIGIPVLDPFKLTNVTLSILGLVDLTLIEGEATGIGKCVVTKFVTNVDARTREPSILCNKIVIKGSYKLTSAMADTCSWCNVHGEGNLNIVLENWFFRIKYPFRFVRRRDGVIYLDALFEKAFYETTVDKVTFEADSVLIGKLDITQHVVSFINRFWELIMRSNIGTYIYDTSVQYYYDIYKTFFDKVPANQYLKDNLDDLVDN